MEEQTLRVDSPLTAKPEQRLALWAVAVYERRANSSRLRKRPKP